MGRSFFPAQKQGLDGTQFDPVDMALRGRIGGHAKAAKYGPEELTGAARRAFRDRFLMEVDPEGVLDPQERQRRAEQARKAWYVRQARKSAIARRARARSVTGAARPEAV